MKEDSSAAKIPTRLRVGLPLACIGTVVIFLFAHLLEGASTELKGHAVITDLDQQISRDNLISAVRRLLDSHAVFMAIIVGLLSGIWPYLKLVCTWLVVVLVDWGRLGSSWGRTSLIVLEALGKYSYADVYMILMNFLIFDISTGGSYTILGFGKLSLHLYMSLHAASVLLIVGVVFSSVITGWAELEIVIAQPEGHADVPERDAERQPLLDENASANLSEKGFGAAAPLQEDAQAHGRKHRFMVLSAGCSFCLALLAIVFTIYGASVPYIRVERGGFLGHLIRPPEDKNLNLSIFNTTRALMAGDRMQQFYGFVNIIISFVMPVLELAGIMVCAVGALLRGASSTVSRSGHLAAAACHSVSCIDVLLLVALATLSELHTVVDFNIGSSCDGFSSLLNNKLLLSIAGLGFAASDSCFDPRTQLQSGFWWLLASIIARFAAWRFVPSR